MRFLLLVLTLTFSATTAISQTTEDSIKMVINHLFTGMKNTDPELIKNCFTDSAILQTIVEQQGGNIRILSDSVDDLIQSIARLPKGAADEKIYFKSIEADGVLAQVWTPYRFYYNGVFSHCGVNSFQLVKWKGEWRIQYLMDTRRKENCEE